MACAVRKPFFFGLWSLFYAPFISFIPINTLVRSFTSRVSVNQVVTLLFVLVNAGLIEFYLLFRFAQSLQSASLCTRGVFRRRAAAAPETTASEDGNRKQCPITRFLGKMEDAIHGHSKGQLAILVLSIANIFVFSAIFFALFIEALGGSLSHLPMPFGSETLQMIIGYGMVFLTLFGTASFIPYLAFRAVMAIGFITRPSRRRDGRADSSRDEEWSLLSSEKF